MLAPQGQYYNYSGCGNTVNCNHPLVRRFVLDCLRYWVTEMHVDGFRFDLGAIMTRTHSLWHPPALAQGSSGAPVPQGGIVALIKNRIYGQRVPSSGTLAHSAQCICCFLITWPVNAQSCRRTYSLSVADFDSQLVIGDRVMESAS